MRMMMMMMMMSQRVCKVVVRATKKHIDQHGIIFSKEWPCIILAKNMIISFIIICQKGFAKWWWGQPINISINMESFSALSLPKIYENSISHHFGFWTLWMATWCNSMLRWRYCWWLPQIWWKFSSPLRHLILIYQMFCSSWQDTKTIKWFKSM